MIKPQHITKEPHHIMIKPHHIMTKAEIITKNLQNIMPKLHHVTEYGRYNMTGPHHIMTKRQNVMINDHIRQLWLSIPFSCNERSKRTNKKYFFCPLTLYSTRCNMQETMERPFLPPLYELSQMF